MIEKAKRIKGLSLGMIFLVSFLSAQQTHNLEVIWVKGVTNYLFYTYGQRLTSGDFNGDGFSDIVIHCCSIADTGHVRDDYVCKAYIFFGGQFDTIPDLVIASDTNWGITDIHGCDINGDGFSDLILGYYGYLLSDEKVLIYFGGNPMDTVLDYTISAPPISWEFGRAIASSDVNGDGFKDLIVGAPATRVLMGQVLIYLGGPYLDSIPDVVLNGGHEGDWEGFGAEVGGGGDVNKDGFSDVIICAYCFGNNQGRVYIYFGGSPMDTIYDVALIGEEGLEWFGKTGVDFLINPREAKDHAIIGSHLWSGGGSYQKGRICVLFGGEDMDSIPDLVIIGRTDTSRLGTSTTNAGFVNEDEESDLLAGAPLEYDYKGRAYLWLGGHLLDTTPDAWITGDWEDNIGWRTATAGDVDGDGRDEIIMSNYVSFISPKRVWCCKYTGTGIEESRSPLIVDRLPIEISPNPARFVVRVRYPSSVKNIKIYDITGKIVKMFDVKKIPKPERCEIKWNLRDDKGKKISAGIYFLEMTAEPEEVSSEQIVREIKKIVITR